LIRIDSVHPHQQGVAQILEATIPARRHRMELVGSSQKRT